MIMSLLCKTTDDVIVLTPIIDHFRLSSTSRVHFHASIADCVGV